MKLLLCTNCFDVFKLTTGHLRQCSCGKVKGRYDDNGSTAETTNNEWTVNLALGNGSVMSAMADMKTHQMMTKDQAGRDEYYQEGNGKIEYAWARPNTGPGNPHTRVLEQS